ncbi:hypothetical protein Cantr_03508 [Candida viswanathii]|uniref:UspA domain-containing protein n=1 Tax=Candida viswanathii TaxID=5486 RepID=A0A367YN59_9ASCO|nr:hypothetical protein Cantr_03508 [Candida viswanathii]
MTTLLTTKTSTTTTTTLTGTSSTPRTTTTTATLPKFSRCVSFNNLNPPEYDTDFPFNSPIYGNGDSTTTSDGNYVLSASSTFHTASLEEYSFGYGRKNSNPLSTASTTRRKRLKLPPPPEKSILKNKVSSQQLEYNHLFQDNVADATINYHREEELLDDEKENSSSSTSSANSSPLLTAVSGNGNVPDLNSPAPRRKSLAGLTDEELMAMDPQYLNTKSNVSQFKFDNQQTYYLSPSSRRTSVPTESSFAKKSMYPSSNDNNYRSFSLTVKSSPTIEPKRRILCVISGRRHTWLAPEAVADNLIDGDHLIVVSVIPEKFMKEKKAEERVDLVCRRLLSYYVSCVEKLLVNVKVTVELVIEEGTNGSTYRHVINNFQPHLVVVGHKGTSSRSSMRSWCIKNMPVPVITVQPKTKRNEPAIRFDDNSSQSLNSSNASIDSTDDKFDDLLQRIKSISDSSLKVALNAKKPSEQSMYKVKSMISIEDDEEVKKKQEMRKKRSESLKSNESAKPKKKSFWKKMLGK